MPPAATYTPVSKRGLILHDVLAFLALLSTSIALFGVTLFLFKSFQAHRVDLARLWTQRGRTALQQNRPEVAVADLRVALTYAPDDETDQLMLAQALAQAGHIEEANNYFLNLWDARPGDGFINLQLARLARLQHDDAEATNYYRASTFGSWEGDGVLRRREVRLELADFLIQQHLNAEARNELFTVAGNSPNNAALNLTVAEKLEAAGYPSDALTFLQKALAADPHNRAILEHAGRLAFTLGDYSGAERLLRRALDEPAPFSETHAQTLELSTLAEDARRIQQLTLSPNLTSAERADHLEEASSIAQARLRTCLASPNTNPHDDPILDNLSVRWLAALAPVLTHQPAATQDKQEALTQLIYSTEQQTAQVCGPPAGDDALLLRLANAAQPPLANLAPTPTLPEMPTEKPADTLFNGSLFHRKAQPNHGN
jgi:Flp pilus assembly protein TadD